MAAPVSARFAEVVTADSYQLISRVEILSPAGAVLLDSDNPATPLSVASGSIDCDAAASFRRTISDLIIVDPDGSLVPLLATDYFSPLASNELRLSVGIVVDGTREYVVQGVFGLEGAVTADTAAGLTIKVSGYDRGMRYSRPKRITPKVFDASASTPIRDAILALLADAVAGTTLNHDSPAALTPSQALLAGGDPWEFSRELAGSMGYELFADRVGALQLARVKDPNDLTLVPAFIYREGTTSLLEVTREASRREVYNGEIVTGMNPSLGSPVRVVVWDTDPASPTYYLGPYGKNPESWQSDKISDVTQAAAAANARLNRNKNATEQVTFTITPNPAIEPGDAVQTVRARSGFPASGPGSGALVVDSFRMPLGATVGPMRCTCRQRSTG